MVDGFNHEIKVVKCETYDLTDDQYLKLCMRSCMMRVSCLSCEDPKY